MKVKINLTTNFISLGKMSVPKELELDPQSNTLLDLLIHLNRLFPHLRLVDDGKMGEDLKYVLLNDVSHFDLPMGLRTELKDGDRVHTEIFMEPLAGG